MLNENRIFDHELVLIYTLESNDRFTDIKVMTNSLNIKFYSQLRFPIDASF